MGHLAVPLTLEREVLKPDAVMDATTAPESADYVFHELTRSLCPNCRRVIDAKILLHDNKVYMKKRCPDCGPFLSLVYADAAAYVAFSGYNKPGTIPLAHSTAVAHGCPHDCGLCPEHEQHACLGIIEVNSACDMDCPLCFADASPGFSLTMEEVEEMLDSFVRTEGRPEVVQFSGGEPTLHPRIIDFIRAAQARDIRFVMINTNGKRIARDPDFVRQLAEVRPAIYFQFDGFEAETYRIIRGEPDLLPQKLHALDRLADAGLDVTLVPAVERGVNEHEVGVIVDFAIRHPAVRGVVFQPAFHAGRHMQHDPLQRLTIPDVVGLIEAQTAGRFVASDFVPIPCCFPTCNSVTYAFVDGEAVTPLPRVVDVRDYLDYIANRVVPDFSLDVKTLFGRPVVHRLRRWLRQRRGEGRHLLPGLRHSGGLHRRRPGEQHDHDHAAGLHGSLDLQPEEPDEVLQGLPAARRWPGPVLRLQHRGLSPAGPRPARRHGARPPAGQARKDRLRSTAGDVRSLAPLRGVPRPMTCLVALPAPEGAKQCCAAAYESEAARWLLGDSFHPGGLQLTGRLGEMMALGPQSRVLDLASGSGASALFIAERFGCQVQGIDLGQQNVDQARADADARGLQHQVAFEVADAERLPFDDQAFDAIICECAFCLFPDKRAAAAEIARLLRPGGRFGMTDLVRAVSLPAELQGLMAWVACIADAQPAEAYVRTLSEAGLQALRQERHDEALARLADRVRQRLFAAEVLVALGKLSWPAFDFVSANELARCVQQAIQAGQLGYTLIVAQKAGRASEI